MGNVVCNSCDRTADLGDFIPYEETELAASNLAYHRGVKCPYCNTADDYTDVDAEWAVLQLAITAKRLREESMAFHPGGSGLVMARRLEAIQGVLEEAAEL